MTNTTPSQPPHQHHNRKTRPIKANPGREPAVPAQYDAIQPEHSQATPQDTFAVLPARRGILSSARAHLSELTKTSRAGRALAGLLIVCATISIGILAIAHHAHNKIVPEPAHQRHAPARATIPARTRRTRSTKRHPATQTRHPARAHPATATPGQSVVAAHEPASEPSTTSTETTETQGGPFSP
jgi:hypothetical protein